MQPRSDFITSNSYEFSYRTSALEYDARHPNIRQTIGWHLLGFRLDVVRLVLYPRWVSHGDNQTIEWGPIATWGVTVPGWSCIAVSAILPLCSVILFWRRRREKRIADGICLRCGYDLRFSPERCPECGDLRRK